MYSGCKHKVEYFVTFFFWTDLQPLNEIQPPYTMARKSLFESHKMII